MIQYKKLMMTLALLLTAATGAWADYYVSGNGSGNWCNGEAWNIVDGLKMTESNGIYSITFANVAVPEEESVYQFKIVLNNWDDAFGATSAVNDNIKLNRTLQGTSVNNTQVIAENITFTITATSDVTISFNPTDKTFMISTTGMKVGDDTPAEPKVYTTAVDVTSLKVGDILAEGFSLTSTNPNGALFNIADQRGKKDETIQPGGYGIDTKNITAYGANATFTVNDGTFYPIDENGNVGNAWVVTQECTQHMGMDLIKIAGVTIVPPLKVTWNATTKTGTFTMPGSDVVLTPRYAAATLYQNDGQTEKMAYETLKEAFANVQDGDVIKLDWDVTFTKKDAPIETSDEGDGVTFTLDLNGYTIDGIALENPCIVLRNANDQMTITDSKLTGGIKGLPATGAGAIIFDGGRYFLGTEVDAENIKDEWANYASAGWQMADGKEFVDIENSPDEKGFTLRVDYAAFELTIGAGRFATFYAAQNVKLDEETPAGVGFYTITSTDEARTKATVTPLTGVVEKETPMLVYNGTDAQQTVKIKVTPAEADAENQGISPLENFMGTAVAKPFTEDDMAAADYYALSGGKLFVPVYDAGTIGKNKCWLQFDKQQTPGARQLTLVFDNETTGVNEVIEVNEVSDDTLYDLNGRRVAKPGKGVFIQNGKKVVK